MRAIKGRRVIALLAIALLGTLILAGGVGTVPIAPIEVIRIFLSRVPGIHLTPTWVDTHELILWNIRFPRVVLGGLVGMALAVAGSGYQGLFKNPLADPYILGVSAGAALGATLAIAFGKVLGLTLLGSIPAAAFAGAFVAVLLVYRLALVGRQVPVTALLLSGVAVGSVCMSVVSTVIYFTTRDARDAITFWLMGGLGGANWSKVGWLMPYLAIGVATFIYYSRDLNAMLLGEPSARHLGVDVERLKRSLLFAGSLLTGAAVAFSGSIGFVGMVVPHLLRMVVGPDHRYLIPASGLAGAILVVTADAVARSLLPAGELPVGLVLALLGGPFFLLLLRERLSTLAG
jgi:iron complex transport system permease protein